MFSMLFNLKIQAAKLQKKYEVYRIIQLIRR